MVLGLPSLDPLQNGQEWRVANPKNGYKTGGQGEVHLQYDTSTHGYKFVQFSSQNPLFTGLEVPYSVKTSSGIHLISKQLINIKHVRLMTLDFRRYKLAR